MRQERNDTKKIRGGAGARVASAAGMTAESEVLLGPACQTPVSDSGPGSPGGRVPELSITECETAREVAPVNIGRALALLARWACRRAGKVLEGGEMIGQNLVTAGDTRSYGARDAKE